MEDMSRVESYNLNSDPQEVKNPINDVTDNLGRPITSIPDVESSGSEQYKFNDEDIIKNHDSYLSALRKHITLQIDTYNQETLKLNINQGNSEGSQKKASKLLKKIDKLAKRYLELKVEQELGNARHQYLTVHKIINFIDQLEQISTHERNTNPQSTSRWFDWLSTNKKQKAFDSAERFSKNPALTDRLEANFDVNAELLTTMICATYALVYFNKVHLSAETSGTNMNAHRLASDESTPQSIRVPIRPFSDNCSHEDIQAFEEADAVNKAVLRYVHKELQNVQKRTDGLIGADNPTMQFWGKVLLALALAISATVAAIALMSALGFALPTFLVPYIAYLQASALVSSVLTFVSTQLSITAAASASATALLTAGIFGGVGYGLNRAGAQTSLKKDLDQAAKDLDAAIAETPAFRASRLG